MTELEQKIRSLKLKKSLLFADIESLSEASDSLYLKYGKVCATLTLLEKQLLQLSKNPLSED
jgi:hypothetical protein